MSTADKPQHCRCVQGVCLWRPMGRAVSCHARSPPSPEHEPPTPHGLALLETTSSALLFLREMETASSES